MIEDILIWTGVALMALGFLGLAVRILRGVLSLVGRRQASAGDGQ